MKLELKNSLSVKLLRVVLLSALAVGVVLSCAQIVFDAYKTRQAVANDAQRILDIFRCQTWTISVTSQIMPKVTCRPWVPTRTKKADRKPLRWGVAPRWIMWANS